MNPSAVPSNGHCIEEFEISRLAKPLEAELQHNTRLIKEEKLNMDRVKEDYARLIRENSVSVIILFTHGLLRRSA